MKKLLFAVAACALAPVFAKDITTGCDLGTFAFGDDDYTLYAYSSVQNYTMSKDVTARINAFTTAFKAAGTVDLGGHTLTPVPQDRGFFQFYYAGNEENSTTFKNGTFNGSSLTSHSLMYSGGGGGTSANLTFDKVIVTGFTQLHLFEGGIANSSLRFTNGSTLDFSNPEYWFIFQGLTYDTINDTLSFESGTTATFKNFQSDNYGLSADKNFDYNNAVVVKGAGTTLSASTTMEIGNGIPRMNVRVEDGATLRAYPTWTGVGNSADGWGAKIVVDNATYSGSRMLLGVSDQAHKNALSVVNGGKLILDAGLVIGHASDNNSLVVTNGDLTGVSGIGIGGYDGSDYLKGCRSGNKAYFCGQDTKFNGWPLVGWGFYGANGLVCFDNCTVSDPTRSFSLKSVNPNPSEAGGDEWTGNELRIVNGAKVSLYTVQVGEIGADSLETREQTLTVGNDATLDLYGSFYNSHCNNKVVISNGTIRVGVNADYGEFHMGWRADGAEYAIDGNVLEFQGDHPQLRTVGKSGINVLMNGTIVRFVLPEDGVYQTIPLDTLSTWADDSAIIEIPNIAKLQETLVGTKEITLIHATKLNFHAAAIEASNAKLPTGCSLRTTNDEETWSEGSVILTVKGSATQKPGAVLLIK